ncbi:MAG: DUF2341 domain-containing protein [Sterolibacteriaceae bacterium]|nr:DUF2341 domain-containing protein [Sterolibacteriaceae bacterium]MBK9085409.1 DUF2341 domain-containing protein [Sterolibacteriaceae bacterium]
MRLCGALGLLLIALTPALAQAKWNADWPHREMVELVTTAEGIEIKETLTALPVAIRLHTGNFLFADSKPDGADIRFVAADDKTVLKHSIERYDAANELAVIWVQVPTLAPGSATQHIWLYHGNPQAPAAADEPKAVFGASSTVFNFSEREGLPKDSGGNAVVPGSGPARLESTGLMGGSAAFTGQAMVLPDVPALRRAPGAAFALSMWLKPDAGLAKASLFRQGGANGLELGIEGSTLRVAAAGVKPVAGGAVRPAVWQHVALVVGAGKIVAYLDGKEVAAAETALPEIAGEVRIGDGLQGQIDALQLLSSAPTAEAIRLTALAQGPDSTFADVVPDDQAEEAAGQHSYMSILVSNLTTDAWVVIGILGVMFVLAVIVMIGKAQFISRTDGANRRFLKRFRDAGEDFANLAAEQAFSHSSLYRLYDAGIREVRKRFAGNSIGAAVAISDASINAIKAAIDADMVRESHRLNAQMVMLTIAISGGPFLGLLGTVVGVMITFAAIAAAGDVNVNAIAPGIAAALLATVAGLAVAIPALFGYNYLASRIKNISADMQIFVDEFVTRLAETYGAR